MLVFFSVAQSIATRTSGVYSHCCSGTASSEILCRTVGNSTTTEGSRNSNNIPTYKAQFVEDPAGYLATDGRIGFCYVNSYVDTTFAQSNLGLAIAWGISAVVIIAFSYVWSCYLTSALLRILKREILQNRAFLSNATSDFYYSWNKYVIYFLMFIIVCGAIILPILASTIPLLFFVNDTADCPKVAISGLQIATFYNLANNAIRNNLILTILSIMWSTFQFVLAVRSLLNEVEEPMQNANPTSLLKEEALVKYFANAHVTDKAVGIEMMESKKGEIPELPAAIPLKTSVSSLKTDDWSKQLLNDSNYIPYGNQSYLQQQLTRGIARVWLMIVCAIPVVAIWVPVILVVFFVN